MKLLLFAFFITFGVVQSVEVNCRFGNMFYGSHNRDQYACVVLNNLSLQRGDKVTAITGQHQAGKTNADVTGFWAEGKTVNFIPKDIEVFFPNIVGLTFANANILEIHEEDFKPFPMLRALFLWQNQIKYLEKNLFRNNPSMGEIKLDENKIEGIDFNAFDNLPILTYLYLNQNPCIDTQGYSQNQVLDVITLAREKCFSAPIENENCAVDTQELEDLKNQLKKSSEEKKVLEENVANLERIIKIAEDAQKSGEDKITEISCLVEKWNVSDTC